jgi:hypothetical protein
MDGFYGGMMDKKPSKENVELVHEYILPSIMEVFHVEKAMFRREAESLLEMLKRERKEAEQVMKKAEVVTLKALVAGRIDITIKTTRANKTYALKWLSKATEGKFI